MPDDAMATVIQMPVANRTQTLPDSNPVARATMRRHILAALLRHGADGLRGDCYCGNHPRSLWRHMATAVAEQTNLLRDYVAVTMDEHRSATGAVDGQIRCVCGDTYSGRYLGRDEHIAEALAANITEAEVVRCLAAIREAGMA